MTTTNLQNKLATAKDAQERGEALDQRAEPTSVMSFLQHPGTLKQVARLLGNEEMAERWVRIGLTEVRRVTGTEGRHNGLADCSWESFAGALMQCAMLELEPGPPLGLAWILPFENRVNVRGQWTTRLDAQFQLGYPGIVQLAHRSGQLATIAAHEVCEGDDFAFDYLTNERRHRPPYRGERGEVYGFYCYAKYANGGEHFIYMTVEQVRKHAERFSQAYQNDLRRIKKGENPTSPWSKDFVAMGRKTVIKQSRPFLPASAKFVLAFAADERVVSWRGHGEPAIEDDAFAMALGTRQPEELPEPSGPADPETGEVKAAAEAAPEGSQSGLPGVDS